MILFNLFNYSIEISKLKEKPGTSSDPNSLREILDITSVCLEKSNGPDNVYGYPAAILLMTFINALGKDQLLCGKDRDSFKILSNKEYYGYDLSITQIDKIYSYFRCGLIHNGRLSTEKVPGLVITIQPEIKTPIEQVNNNFIINLNLLLEKSKEVFEKFKVKIPVSNQIGQAASANNNESYNAFLDSIRD